MERSERCPWTLASSKFWRTSKYKSFWSARTLAWYIQKLGNSREWNNWVISKNKMSISSLSHFVSSLLSKKEITFNMSVITCVLLKRKKKRGGCNSGSQPRLLSPIDVPNCVDFVTFQHYMHTLEILYSGSETPDFCQPAKSVQVVKCLTWWSHA